MTITVHIDLEFSSVKETTLYVRSITNKEITTACGLDSMVAQFSWISLVPLIHELTSFPND